MEFDKLTKVMKFCDFTNLGISICGYQTWKSKEYLEISWKFCLQCHLEPCYFDDIKLFVWFWYKVVSIYWTITYQLSKKSKILWNTLIHVKQVCWENVLLETILDEITHSLDVICHGEGGCIIFQFSEPWIPTFTIRLSILRLCLPLSLINWPLI